MGTGKKPLFFFYTIRSTLILVFLERSLIIGLTKCLVTCRTLIFSSIMTGKERTSARINENIHAIFSMTSHYRILYIYIYIGSSERGIRIRPRYDRNASRGGLVTINASKKKLLYIWLYCFKGYKVSRRWPLGSRRFS